jgi:thioesterase domain-containing protein
MLNAELPLPGTDGDPRRPAHELLGEVAAALRGPGAGYQPDAADLQERLAAFATVTGLSCAHRPLPYPGPVHLVEAADGPAKAAGWRPFCGSLEVTQLPGNHYTVLRRAPERLAEIGARLLGEFGATPAPGLSSNVNG